MAATKSTKSPKHFLSSEAIAAADDLEAVDIEIPQWGGWVKLRPLTMAETDQITRDVTDDDGRVDPLRSDLYCLAAAMIEPQYDRESIMALADKNSTVVQTLVNKMVLLQGGGKGALERFEKSVLER